MTAMDRAKVRCKKIVEDKRKDNPFYVVPIQTMKKILNDELGDMAINDGDSILDYVAEIGREINQFDNDSHIYQSL